MKQILKKIQWGAGAFAAVCLAGTLAFAQGPDGVEPEVRPEGPVPQMDEGPVGEHGPWEAMGRNGRGPWNREMGERQGPQGQPWQGARMQRGPWGGMKPQEAGQDKEIAKGFGGRGQRWAASTKGLGLTEEQREQLQAVREEFMPKMKELQEKHAAEMKALAEEMKAKTEAVFTDEQKAQLEELKKDIPTPMPRMEMPFNGQKFGGPQGMPGMGPQFGGPQGMPSMKDGKCPMGGPKCDGKGPMGWERDARTFAPKMNGKGGCPCGPECRCGEACPCDQCEMNRGEGRGPRGEMNRGEGRGPRGEMNRGEGRGPRGEMNRGEGRGPRGEMNRGEGRGPRGEMNRGEGRGPRGEMNRGEGRGPRDRAPEVTEAPEAAE